MPKRDLNGNWIPTDEDIRRAELSRRGPDRPNRQELSPVDTPEEASEARRRAALIDQF